MDLFVVSKDTMVLSMEMLVNVSVKVKLQLGYQGLPKLPHVVCLRLFYVSFSLQDGHAVQL